MPSPMPPPFEPLELAAWGGMLEFHAAITDQLSRALEDSHGLRLGEYEALIKLAMSDGGVLPMAELRQRTFLTRSQSGLSRLVDRLCNRRYLERGASMSTDQRNVAVAITDSGRKAVESAAREHAERVHTLFFERLSDTEVRTLARVWKRLMEPAPAS